MREFGIASIVLLLALTSLTAPMDRVGEVLPHRVEVDVDDERPVHEQLRVLTYNVFLRPPPVGWGDRTVCRARHIGQTLAGEPIPRDILVFNETFDGHALSKLADAISERFPYRILAYPKAQGLSTNGGLSLFSRFPVERWTAERFRHCSGNFNDCMATKGFLHALIRVSSHLKVNVLATHLNSGGDANAQQARREQLAQIRDFVNSSRLFDRWPTLLMGDLNVNGIRFGPVDPATGRSTEYARTMSFLGNTCVSCQTAQCFADCRSQPVDTFRRDQGFWSFTAAGTRPVNTHNCSAQSMRPCRSPNAPMNWQHRTRLDYVLHFGAPRLMPDLMVDVLEANNVAFPSDACGTTYLSDHQGVEATLEFRRHSDLTVELSPTSKDAHPNTH